MGSQAAANNALAKARRSLFNIPRTFLSKIPENAPRTLGPQQQGPNISVQINVNARQVGQTDYEVNLVLEGSAGEGENTLFKFELNYAGVFPASGEYPGRADPARGDVIEGPRLLPVRAADYRRRRAQWRLSPALYRPD